MIIQYCVHFYARVSQAKPTGLSSPSETGKFFVKKELYQAANHSDIDSWLASLRSGPSSRRYLHLVTGDSLRPPRGTVTAMLKHLFTSELTRGGGEGGRFERGTGGIRPPLADGGNGCGDMRRSLRGDPASPMRGGGERRRISGDKRRRIIGGGGDLRRRRGDGERGRRFGSGGCGLRLIGDGERRRIGMGEWGERCRLRIGGNGDGVRRLRGGGDRGERLRRPPLPNRTGRSESELLGSSSRYSFLYPE